MEKKNTGEQPVRLRKRVSLAERKENLLPELVEQLMVTVGAVYCLLLL